jgi:hypothetical protein
MSVYQQELNDITKAISFILNGGQSFTINSGTASRQVTMVDYEKLLKRKRELESLIETDNRGGSFRIGAGW